jgi:hypothetical protein
VDIGQTYDRHAEKLREELTLARIDRHSGQLEELDVEGIWRLQSASCRVPPISGCRLPSTNDSGSNNCSFPTESRSTDQNSGSWNQINNWLRHIDGLRLSA